jgi:hypothetical protein
MSWSFQVDDSHSIGFGIDGNGAEYVYGDAVSSIFEGETSPMVPQRIKNAKAEWTVRTPESDDASLDPNGLGLYQAVREAPEKVHAIIQFFQASEYSPEDLIGTTVCVPRERFLRIRELFEMTLTSRLPTRTVINLDFFEFARDEGKHIPTVHTFMNYGKSILVGGAQFTTRRIVD